MSTSELLLAEALPAVEVVLRDLARRYRLSSDEQEEFRSVVLVRLIEDDHAILRKFEQRSSLTTYLRIVVTRLFLDERVKVWGRWRPSAEAVRLGPLAVDLERLLERQHLPLDQAIATLRSRDASLDEADITALADQLPRRITGRRLVDEEELHTVADGGPGSDHLVRSAEAEHAGAHLAAALRAATAPLPSRARLLLRLRYEQGASIADISRVLREPQKPLYREFERLLRDLRRDLEARGVGAEHVLTLTGEAADRLEGVLTAEPDAKPAPRAVSLPGHDGMRERESER